ncbi:hypothetical protein MXB_4993 [Myxobolus squamalis]|nr:hypothetical protein MXB_4993 [Myxobolus squamalis]
MHEYLNTIENGLACFETQYPDLERFVKVSKSVNDAIACYTIIYKENKRATRQTILDQVIRLTQKPSGRINRLSQGPPVWSKYDIWHVSAHVKKHQYHLPRKP